MNFTSKHLRVITLILIANIFLLNEVHAQPILPYVIGVKVFGDGSPIENASVSITNLRTEQILSGISNSNGEYVGNLANFKEGYRDGETISIKVCMTSNVCQNVEREVKRDKGGTLEVFNFDLPKQDTLTSVIIKMILTMVSFLFLGLGFYLAFRKRRLSLVLTGLVSFGIGLLILFFTWIAFDILRGII